MRPRDAEGGRGASVPDGSKLGDGRGRPAQMHTQAVAVWIDWHDLPSIALAVVLAFVFGIVSLRIAGLAAFPVNRWLIARGQGHALVHGHH